MLRRCRLGLAKRAELFERQQQQRPTGCRASGVAANEAKRRRRRRRRLTVSTQRNLFHSARLAAQLVCIPTLDSTRAGFQAAGPARRTSSAGPRATTLAHTAIIITFMSAARPFGRRIRLDRLRPPFGRPAAGLSCSARGLSSPAAGAISLAATDKRGAGFACRR